MNKNEEIAKQFAEMKGDPIIEMENGAVLYLQYNKETNQVEVGTSSNVGLFPEHEFDYDPDLSLDKNLQSIYGQLSEMPEYQRQNSFNVDKRGQKQFWSDMKDEVMATVETIKKAQSQVQVKEDNNPHTNVGADVKAIAETGTVTPDKAEKIAEEQSKEQTHKEYHEKQAKDTMKEKQEDQEKKLKEDEVKKNEAQRKDQEKARQQSGANKVSMAEVHAAILGAALAYAADHDGVVMNVGGKGGAQFVGSRGVQISPYNDMLMTMQADRNNWRTNAYVFSYDTAKADDIPVKKGEKALPLNWIHWYYEKNGSTGKENAISTKQFRDLSDEAKKGYTVKSENQTMRVFNVDQTSMPSKDKAFDKYIDLVRSEGSRMETISDFSHNDVLKRNKDLEKLTPKTIVLWKKGDDIHPEVTAYGSSARALAKNSGLKLEDTVINDKKGKMVTVPVDKQEQILNGINKAGWAFTVMDVDKDRAFHLRHPMNADKVMGHVQKLVSKVSMDASFKTERVLKDVPSHYNPVEDKLTFSGLGEKHSYDASQTLGKANEVYRSLVDAIGSSSRLDRENRIDMIPSDAEKYEGLVRDLSAAVLMGRDGLPARLSPQSMKNVDFFRQELEEHPSTVNVIAKYINETVETIDRHERGIKGKYDSVRGQYYNNYKVEDFSVISKLNDIPAKETKEVAIVYDKENKHADVILPADASLSTEKGMRKDRIEKALAKQGYTDVVLYNAGGENGLKEENSYFDGKDIQIGRLNQYELIQVKKLDPVQDLGVEKNVVLDRPITAVKGVDGKYVFLLRPHNEPSFTIRPEINSYDMNKFFNVVSPKKQAPGVDRDQVLKTLGDKYYRLAEKQPDLKIDALTPEYDKSLDFARLERKVKNGDTVKEYKPNIWTDKNDRNKHYVVSYVDDKFMKKKITRDQFNNLFNVDDMQHYKYALAANMFAEELGVAKSQSQSEAQSIKEGEKEEEKVNVQPQETVKNKPTAPGASDDQDNDVCEDNDVKLDGSATTGGTGDLDGDGVSDNQEDYQATKKEDTEVKRSGFHR